MRLLLAPLLLVAACGTGYRDREDSAAMGREIEDRNTASRVRIALAADPETATLDALRVTCIGGVVTLEGCVDRPGALRRAVEIAENCEGVRAVVDRLTVASAAR